MDMRSTDPIKRPEWLNPDSRLCFLFSIITFLSLFAARPPEWERAAAGGGGNGFPHRGKIQRDDTLPNIQ